ncbi:MAG: NAD-dependent epimerase/dehydratase family protein [Limisphaerales bacterium]
MRREFIYMKVLVTGGLGFIGSSLVRRLLHDGNQVSIIDNLSPQIHGLHYALPRDLADSVQLFPVDIRDTDRIREPIRGAEVIVHLAAETGTGQSMYELGRYESVNIGGTAALIECCVKQKPANLKTVVVASSRAVYGEGACRCREHGVVCPAPRTKADMSKGDFEPRCPKCNCFCCATPTTEATPCNPASFYGLTKQVQEQMTIMFARHLGIGAFALRLQNVYGPGQSLKNPYTGILAIFSNLARQNRNINIFEDGEETRDFVYIEDVVDAFCRCIRLETSATTILNIGSGKQTSVNDVVRTVTGYFKSNSRAKVTGDFRLGDIRHNVADIGAAAECLGYVPVWGFQAGIARFLAWAAEQPCEQGGYDGSLEEMRARGLMGVGTQQIQYDA